MILVAILQHRARLQGNIKPPIRRRLCSSISRAALAELSSSCAVQSDVNGVGAVIQVVVATAAVASDSQTGAQNLTAGTAARQVCGVLARVEVALSGACGGEEGAVLLGGVRWRLKNDKLDAHSPTQLIPFRTYATAGTSVTDVALANTIVELAMCAARDSEVHIALASLLVVLVEKLCERSTQLLDGCCIRSWWRGSIPSHDLWKLDLHTRLSVTNMELQVVAT
mmetsp:Transcript_46296/g.110180  ORF Transcript_46296/g.110180 Transcript_46296/m.110180 type:complete len:225 (-) Transcript_46296:1421-2095(-)